MRVSFSSTDGQFAQTTSEASFERLNCSGTMSMSKTGRTGANISNVRDHLCSRGRQVRERLVPTGLVEDPRRRSRWHAAVKVDFEDAPMLACHTVAHHHGGALGIA